MFDVNFHPNATHPNAKLKATVSRGTIGTLKVNPDHLVIKELGEGSLKNEFLKKRHEKNWSTHRKEEHANLKARKNLQIILNKVSQSAKYCSL